MSIWMVGLLVASASPKEATAETQAAPTVRPLENEPIIQTLEGATERAAVPQATQESQPASAAATTSTQRAESHDLGTRRVALYVVVVFSLLGVMTIAILLILRHENRDVNTLFPEVVSLETIATPSVTQTLAASHFSAPQFQQPMTGDPMFTSATTTRAAMPAAPESADQEQPTYVS